MFRLMILVLQCWTVNEVFRLSEIRITIDVTGLVKFW